MGGDFLTTHYTRSRSHGALSQHGPRVAPAIWRRPTRVVLLAGAGSLEAVVGERHEDELVRACRSASSSARRPRRLPSSTSTLRASAAAQKRPTIAAACHSLQRCKAPSPNVQSELESERSARALGEVRGGTRPARQRRVVNTHAHLVGCGRRPLKTGPSVGPSRAPTAAVGVGVGGVWAFAKTL